MTMSEVSEKKAITSSDFPVVLFGAGGTLLHANPPLRIFYQSQLKLMGHAFTDLEIEKALIRSLKRLNEQSEKDDSYQSKAATFVDILLDELALGDAEKIKDMRIRLLDAYTNSIRVVIADTTVKVCEELKERGYRLGIISNWGFQLNEILRLQGVLDLFDSVITAMDVGYAKPHPEIFKAALEDLDVGANEVVFVGSSFASDIVGAQRAKMQTILYDPEHIELRALDPEDTSSKVVPIDHLRKNRALQGIKVITKFEELKDYCK